MPKRYYCDYCNKSFQDNPRNRSKHMKGFIHLRNKEVYYKTVQVTLPDLIEQQRLAVFMSSVSGEEILQQWLKQHPEIVKRYKDIKARITSTQESKTPGENQSTKELSEENVVPNVAEVTPN